MAPSPSASGGEGSNDEGGINPPNDPGLHKPGVAGSSPAAATFSVRENEPITEYHGDKSWFSKSSLWDLKKQGPQVFFARHISGVETSSPQSESLARGTLVHQWAELGDRAFTDLVTIIPADVLGAEGRRTQATAKWLAEEQAKGPGRIFLKQEEFDSIKAQTDAIRANPIFDDLSAATTHREVSIRWRDVGSNLPLKCRPDAIAGSTIWDIKTTRDERPLESFWKSVVDYGYGLQAVLYMEGCRAAGFKVEDFVFLVTSTVPPFACHAVRLPARLLTKERKALRKVIAEVQMRIECDHWLPSDAGKVTELFVPERYLEEKKHGDRPRHARVF